MLAAHDNTVKRCQDESVQHFKWLHPDTSFEVRAISRNRKGRPECSVFSTEEMEVAESWVQSAEGSGYNLYVTLNPVPDKHHGKVTDKEIARRTNLLIDIDPVRLAETNATDDEKEAANRLASDVKLWLSNLGFPPPLVISSGNGFHLTYAVDLPTDDKELVRSVLVALGRKFDNSDVKIDRKVFNPSRITKIAGTLAGKQKVTADRPLRMSRIVGEVPTRVVAGSELLQRVVDSINSECGPELKQEPKGGRTKRSINTHTLTGKQSRESEPRQGQAIQASAEPRHDTPFDERIRRAGLYFDAIPDSDLSRSGHNGHSTFLMHTCCVVNGFLVRDRDQFRKIIESHYNNRLLELRESNPEKSSEWEPWSTSEIDHKFDEAVKKTHADERFPPGWLLNEESDPREWNDPVRAAELFIKSHVVLRVRGRWMQYDGKRWIFIEDESVSCGMRKLLEREADRATQRRIVKWEKDKNKLCEEANELRKHLTDETSGLWDTKAEESAFNREQEKAKKELARVEKKLHTPRPVAPSVARELVANCVDTLKARTLHAGDADVSTPIKLDVWMGVPSGSEIEGVREGSWLAVENGILELNSIKLLPHSPNWFSTVCVPSAFDVNAPEPTKWLGLLQELFEGDTERIGVVQELFGACLDRNFPAKNFFAFVGSGENGKSVVLTVLRAMLGERNVSAVPLDQLNSNRFASFGLLGKMANIGGDQSYFESSDEGNLKTLTGGDVISFEQKGKDAFCGVNSAKLVVSCNTPPKFSDKSEGIWNRLIMLPFLYRVPSARKNPLMNTVEFWQGELPGILSWAIAGFHRLKANRAVFTRSTAGDMMKYRHRLDSNPARAFLCETVEPGETPRSVAAPALYAEYVTWLSIHGYKHRLTAHAFSKEVQAAFPDVVNTPKRVNGKLDRHWIGIVRRLEQSEGVND